ncbi:hypothetical protein SDC9_154043 [bioreactor metagenome]|uniref:Uncharacterized protein n=1 Tax=bioreactor metagenome TaxID=1076179 RepID=A0A645EZC8_9ZZZZ
MHFDAQLVAAAPAANQHAALGRVADGVRQQVLQDAPEQCLVAVHHIARADGGELESPAFRDDAEVVLHHLQQRAEREVAHMHVELARLHARNVEQAVENAVLRGQRAFDAVGHVAAGVVMQMAAQQ